VGVAGDDVPYNIIDGVDVQPGLQQVKVSLMPTEGCSRLHLQLLYAHGYTTVLGPDCHFPYIVIVALFCLECKLVQSLYAQYEGAKHT
jgi:hypothetical protein